jgi:hypothetical protein
MSYKIYQMIQTIWHMISSLCIECLKLIYYVVKTSMNMYDHLCMVMTMYCVFVWLRLVCGCE